MKLLLLNSLYPPHSVGGAEKSVSILARALVQEGINVSVLTLTSTAASRTREDGVTVIRAPLRNLYWSFGRPRSALKYLWHAIDTFNPLMRRCVRETLESERPDVVHTHNIAGFSVAAWETLARQNKPIVHTLRDMYLLCPRYHFRAGNKCDGACLDCHLLRRPHKRLSNRINAVIGISGSVLEAHLRQNYFRDTTTEAVIGNAYIGASTALGPSPSATVRFGYLGRVEPAKGFNYLMQALKTLPARNWELIVGGHAPPDIMRFLAEHNELPIQSIGWVEPEKFFPRIDVLIVPSILPEAFGRSVIEGFAHGIPAIVSNSGGLPELVENGKTGYVFNLDDPKSLPNALRHAIAHKGIYAAMASACRTKAEAFAPDRIARQHIRLYESLL